MKVAPVSVVIPAYNSSATIGRALASIAAQTLLPAQVVVVDDGSADDTQHVAMQWQPRLGPTRLVVVRQANRGAGAARNAAIGFADQEWLAFLDADDEWLPEKLERSMSQLTTHSLAFISHGMIVRTQDGREIPFDCARHFHRAANPFAALMIRGFVATSTVIAQRDFVVAAGGFDESLPAAQDYDLWLKLASSHRFLVFSDMLTRYHVTSGSITTNVPRRRYCSLLVLRRHLHKLNGWGGMTVTILRSLVIQYESMMAWRTQGRWRAAFWEVLRTPGTIVVSLLCLTSRGKFPPA